jgi:hypothetical protein
LLAEVVLDAQDVGADAFAAIGEAIAIALQTAFVQDDFVVAVGAVNGDSERLLVHAREALWLFLIAVCFRDQAVQVRLQHGACRPSW